MFLSFCNDFNDSQKCINFKIKTTLWENISFPLGKYQVIWKDMFELQCDILREHIILKNFSGKKIAQLVTIGSVADLRLAA